jgi:hypothetical protein
LFDQLFNCPETVSLHAGVRQRRTGWSRECGQTASLPPAVDRPHGRPAPRARRLSGLLRGPHREEPAAVSGIRHRHHDPHGTRPGQSPAGQLMTHPAAVTLGRRAAFPAAVAGGVRTRRHEAAALPHARNLACCRPPFRPLFSSTTACSSRSWVSRPSSLAPTRSLAAKQTPIKNRHCGAV